jgi:endoglycosylceramidase
VRAGGWRVSVIAALVAGGLIPAAKAAAPSAAAPPPLPWLTVAHPAGQRAQLVDPAGRTVILHGVNVVGVEDDFYTTPSGQEPGPVPMWPIDTGAYDGTCPQMDHHAGEAPVCEASAGLPEFQQPSDPGSHNDLAQMRALGFNFIRLGLSWSQLEPTPGTYSRQYLDRVAQAVGWAREQGVYALLDMHQDNYSRYTPETAPASVPPLLTPVQESSAHADGAPLWAVITEGEPALALGGQGPFNAYVAAAFNSFWLNRIPSGVRQGAAPGPGLQDHYIGAMAALAQRFKDDSTVAGYEIMNEPLPGTIPPAVFSATALYPFYTRVVDALTGTRDGVPAYPDLGVGVRRQAFFFEPMAVRNLEDAPDQLPLPFSSYPGLVYSPHTYTHSLTADRAVGVSPSTSPYPLSYDQAFVVADAEARSMGAALLPGEYGNSASDDEVVLRDETAAQDKAGVGSAIYAWKGVCRAGAKLSDCYDAWSVYAGDPATPPAQNLGLIPSRVKFLSRVFPMATAGSLRSFSYDPDRRAFIMTATASTAVGKGRPTIETVVFIPSTVTGSVSASGHAVMDQVVTEPDGTRRAYVAPTGQGDYQVSVR